MKMCCHILDRVPRGYHIILDVDAIIVIDWNGFNTIITSNFLSRTGWDNKYLFESVSSADCTGGAFGLVVLHALEYLS